MSPQEIKTPAKHKLETDAQLTAKIAKKRAEWHALAKKLETLRDDIRTTKEYYDEQEKTVNTTIQEWNSVLVGFRQEADAIKLEKIKLTGEVVRLEEDKLAMIQETKAIESKLLKLQEVYNERVASYRLKLQNQQ